MPLDGTAIVAQIINFAVLVWLLNRFLYRPITGIIAAREEKVRRRLEQAEAKEAEAQQARETYQQLQDALERERGRLLAEAREEARRERARLLEVAAEEAREARRRFSEALAQERAELMSSFQERLVRHVCDVSGHVLSHLGGVTLADAIISTLEARWEDGERPLTPITPMTPVVVRTSFEPTPEQKARLAALAAKVGPANVGQGPLSAEIRHDAADRPSVEFQIDPGLLLGVEIEAGGVVVSWTARDILESLQDDALLTLGSATSPGPSVAGESGEVKRDA